MDDKTSTLIAVGASAAVNCRPCLAHHLAAARAQALDPQDVAAAMEVGLQVGEGANRKTREHVAELLSGTEQAAVEQGCQPSVPGGEAACAVSLPG